MPLLKVPESGLSFDSVSEQSSKSTTQDIIGLTLTDDLIEEMIQCVQNGKQIHLSLGPRPNLSFGNTTQPLADYKDPFAHEIYLATNDPTSRNGITMAPAGKPCIAFQKMFNPKYAAKMAAQSKSTITATKSVTAGADTARENLEKSMALAKAKKEENTTKLISLGTGGKKSKLLAQSGRLNDAPRSMPSSPALSGVGSPSLGPTSIPASQMITEQAKANRRAIVHLLAVRPMTETELRERVDDLSDNDFKQALNKVADKVQNGKEFELFKPYYKELDIWTFNYESEEDRQKAIDNAVKKYDQLRIPPNDDEWERLKPIDKRGDGQTLSKVQARIAQGPIPRTPKINVSNADSGRDTPGQDSEAPIKKALGKNVKDASNRSSSSQPPTNAKNKRISEKEAQSKRLLSTKSKPAPVSAQKKEVPSKVSNAKPLSSQFVTDSDDEEAAAATTIVTATKPKPAPKKAAPPQKRAREEQSSNDSSQPLPKKARAGNGKPVEPASENNAKSFSQNSASTARTKGTSPQKSSPLASSPPTNASDFASSANSCAASDSSTPRHHSAFNSKAPRSPVHKRNASSSSLSTTSSISSTGSHTKIDQSTLQLASNFRIYYPKYAALHKELSKIREQDREQRKVDQLIDMHERLVDMKTKIKQAASRVAH